MENRYENRIVTLPNALTLFRVLLIPVFVWLYGSLKNHVWSAAVLGLSALTDLVDGWMARHFRRVQHQMPDAGGQALAVHDEHVFKFPGGDAGVLIAAGHVAADGEMHQSVVILQMLLKKRPIILHVHRGGGAYFSALLRLGKHLVRSDLNAVEIGLSVQNHAQRRDLDSVPFNPFS